METLAPWAEPVLMTADDLVQLPEDEWRYELVEGELVRMSPTGAEYGWIVMALLAAVYRFVEVRQLGEVFPAETGFWISSRDEPDTVLAADIAFVRAEHTTAVSVAGFPRLAPHLVTEVASPSQRHAELAVKARRWLKSGVQLVWIVFPQTQTVEVWRDGDLAHTLTVEDELSSEAVLPGFVYPIARLFPSPPVR